MPDPTPPVAAEPTGPRVPDRLNSALDDDLDPQFPDLDGVDLEATPIDLPEARTFTVLRSRLRSCTLALDDADLDAQDAHLVDLDLRGMRIEGLHRVVFERCRLTGADFGESRLRDVRFDDCALDLASMRSTTIERVAITGGRIDDLDLSAARLTDVLFAGVGLGDITLTGARLERVDVTEADVNGVSDLRELHGAILSTTQAVELAPRLAHVAGMSVAAPLSHR